MTQFSNTLEFVPYDIVIILLCLSVAAVIFAVFKVYIKPRFRGVKAQPTPGSEPEPFPTLVIVKGLVINGVARSGKDTLVDLLKIQPNTVVIARSSIDEVKRIARECGWDGEKNDKSRKFLSDLKYLLTDYNDTPFKCAMQYLHAASHLRRMSQNIQYVYYCVFSREPNDIERYKAELSKTMLTSTVLVRRKVAEDNTPNNTADQGVLNQQYDIVLNNDGSLDEFEQVIKTTL